MATVDPRDALRRGQLAGFLRARRSELEPETLGISTKGVRRVPGLRRDEVADRAGISQSLYAWLEQARDVTATTSVLDAIARALCLDGEGRRYMRQLTEEYDSAASEPRPGTLTPLLPALDAMPTPTYIVGRFYDLLAWNDSYVALIGADPAELHPQQRNAIRLLLTSERLQQHMRGWDVEAERGIALLRHSFVVDPGNPRFFDIVSDLEHTSDLFNESWPHHRIVRFTAHDVTFDGPDGAEVRTVHTAVRPPDQPDVTMMMYVPEDQTSAAGLRALLGSGSTS